jgi:FKBP-type peptidyl-prolyl cis-trans isomerase
MQYISYHARRLITVALPVLFTTAACMPRVPGPGPAIRAPIHTAYALQYVDIVVGKGDVATAGKSVTVHYTGWLKDGKKFDSSLDRGKPFTFQLGAGQVIPGWDGGVEGMKVGGKRRLLIPYQLAYGSQSRDPIPANSNLTFDVELLSVQ